VTKGGSNDEARDAASQPVVWLDSPTACVACCSIERAKRMPESVSPWDDRARLDIVPCRCDELAGAQGMPLTSAPTAFSQRAAPTGHGVLPLSMFARFPSL